MADVTTSEAPRPCASPYPVVAVFNSNDDVLEMLRTLFETAGFIVASAHVSDIKRGNLNVRDFIAQHDPCVIVYDLVPPYDRNSMFLEHLRSDGLLQGRKFVITSANAAQAEAVLGTSEHVYEIVGKPLDLDQILLAVREASKARAVR